MAIMLDTIMDPFRSFLSLVFLQVMKLDHSSGGNFQTIELAIVPLLISVIILVIQPLFNLIKVLTAMVPKRIPDIAPRTLSISTPFIKRNMMLINATVKHPISANVRRIVFRIKKRFRPLLILI